MIKKLFLPLQLTIHLLLLLKPFLFIPTFVYFPLLIFLFLARHFHEGNTFSIIFQFAAFLILFAADMLSSPLLMYGGVVVVVGSIVISPTIYEFPQPDHKVNLKQNMGAFGSKELYWIEWVRIDEGEVHRDYKMDWGSKGELKKLCEHISIENSPFLFRLASFLSSNIMKRKIKVAEGVKRKGKNGVVLFSHGKTTTPRMYTFLQKHLAKQYKVLAPQHEEVNKLANMEEHQIKEHRQKEVKVRAKDIQFLALNEVAPEQNIILVGHSYGCATILQAYHQNPLVRAKVTKIILLDPWLYSLDSSAFAGSVESPVLLLSNELFVRNDDINSRNKLFIKLHESVIQKCWKKGDHAHQSDLLFILGNCLGRFKNAELSEKMFRMNFDVIDLFLEGESKQKIEQMYKEWDMSE